MKNMPDHGTRLNRKWKYEVPLSRLDFEVLITIAMGSNTNKQLHEKLRKRKGKSIPKSTISRHTTKLEKLGLITQKKIFNFRPFELTEKATVAISIFLTEGVGEKEQVVRGHGFGFVCEILRKPKGLEERLKDGGWGEFYPRNRVGYKRSLWGCTVIFNPRSVQFIPQEVYSASQDGAFDVAYKLVLKVQDFLQTEYEGLVLGPVTTIYNQQYARMFDPLAVEFLKTSMKENVNLTYRSDRLAIDQSKKAPELETIHKVFSKDDLRKICAFYEGLIRSDFKIEDVEDLKESAKLQAMAGFYLAQNLKTHVDVLNEIKAAIVELRKGVSGNDRT
jgi:DNA-binding transcriptional ArsR family regulator